MVNGKYAKMMGMILALNFESLAIFMGCWYAGGWLNEKYPNESVDWQNVLIIVGILGIIWVWVRFVALLKAQMNKMSEDEKISSPKPTPKSCHD